MLNILRIIAAGAILVAWSQIAPVLSMSDAAPARVQMISR